MQKWRLDYKSLSLSAKFSMSWQVITMRADVAKGKARLPFLFLVLDSEQENADEGVCVGEQKQKMHPEQRREIPAQQHSTFTFHQC